MSSSSEAGSRRRLEGKIAIVTGAANGIGAATARAMAAEGACVAVADRDEPGTRRVVEEIVGGGGTALAVGVDVREETSIAAMVETTVSAWGRIDVLHNNAAVLFPEVQRADDDLLALDIDVWDLVMEVNVRGTMLGCKHAVPHMRAAGAGAIVNTASVQATGGTRTLPAYGTSKTAIVGLTRYVAAQFGVDGIRCNAVAPSFTLTPGAMRVTSDDDQKRLLGLHPLGRLGCPEDVAAAVVYLSCDESAFVTGHLLMVDGGRTAMVPGSFA